MTRYKDQRIVWTLLLGMVLTSGLFGCSAPPKQDTTPTPLKVAAEPNQTVDLPEKITFSLALTPGTKSRYQAITETTWTLEGPVPPTASESSELVFSQEILAPNTEDPHAAVALVTIEQATYARKLPGQADLSCNSRDMTHPDNPFAQLIGKTYAIEISPLGYASGVFNLSAARQAVRGSTPAHDAALDLLSPARIFARHGSFSLPGADLGPVAPGGRWRGAQQFTLKAPLPGRERLGTRRFDKIYRLERAARRTDGTVAVVTFAGTLRPSRREGASQSDDPILSYAYTGGGEFNVGAGRVEAYADFLEARLSLAQNSLPPTTGAHGSVVLMKRHFQMQRLDQD